MYTETILENIGMKNAKSVHKFPDASTKLVKAIDDSDEIDNGLYQSAVGSLPHLSSRISHIDIVYAVCK